MKYYTYIEPDDDGGADHYVTLSSDEIIDQYWEYWKGQMEKVGKDLSNYNQQDCIDDFCILHWAVESK